MQRKIILFTVTTLFLLIGGTCCEHEETIPPELVGTWKLEGFGDSSDNSLIKINHADYNESYFNYIFFSYVFKGNALFDAYSTRLYRAKIHVQAKNNKLYFKSQQNVIYKSDYPLDKNTQLFEKATSEIIRKTEAEFEIREKKLIVFYTDTEFLEFYQINN